MSDKFYNTALGLLFLCLNITSTQAQSIVNFDGLDAPALFDDQNIPTDDYSDGFVSFSGPAEVLSVAFVPGISAPNALKWNNINGDNPTTSETVINFLEPVENVSFNIGAAVVSPEFPTSIVSIQAFDANGSEISFQERDVQGTALQIIDVSGSGISQIIIGTPAFSAGCIDDVTYTIVEEETCSEDFIADAGEDQQLYIGYPPLRTTTLEVDFSGGAGEETILWSTGETTPAIHICPEETTTYTVTVTDANGCEASDEVTVEVEDVRCGWKGKRVVMCYRGWNYCVRKKYVWFFHYYYGATIGFCGNNSRKDLGDKPEIDFAQFDGQINSETASSIVEIYPNPATDFIIVNPGMFMDTEVQISIFDISGKVISQSSFENMGQERIDVSQFNNGIYHLRLEDLEGTTETHRFLIQ